MTENQPHSSIQISEPSTNGFPLRKLSSIEKRKFPAEATVTFHNICYRVKVKSGFLYCQRAVLKQILKDINGIMRPGLNAILGPTGSGKSSLLDILAARKDPHGLSGEILINGAPRPANFKCISGYVVQVNEPAVTICLYCFNLPPEGDTIWIKINH
uniref:ABC transporter domain-containing protein n=1 Tax=Chrysemys picta bellii TaxID=8478 RepID=A0A8C3FH62_CHRPI